jgi:hypothetical protein
MERQMSYTTDGATRLASVEDITPGVVLRSVDSEDRTYPFGDLVVTRINGTEEDFSFDAVRPYAMEHLGDFMMGTETVRGITPSKLRHFRLVLLASGKPYTHTLTRQFAEEKVSP